MFQNICYSVENYRESSLGKIGILKEREHQEYWFGSTLRTVQLAQIIDTGQSDNVVCSELL